MGLRRIDLIIVNKILDELYSKGRYKRTNLALICNMSYDRFIQYMEIMITLDLILIEIEKNCKYVNITSAGIAFLKTHH